MIDRREMIWMIFKRMERWMPVKSWLDTKHAVEWAIDEQVHNEVNLLILSSWGENTKGD